MLRDGGNLRINSLDAAAKIRSLAYLGRVALQCAVDEGCSHGRDVASSFGVGKGLVRGRLLEAFDISNLS
jgi:hypothetical protein